MSKIEITGSGRKWFVMQGQAVLAGPFYTHDKAAKHAAAADRKAHHRTLPCMCCREDFTSTGAHHRMCNTCRTRSEGMI